MACPGCHQTLTGDTKQHQRILDPQTAPELEYERTTSTARHIGQLKLLLSEIEFLTPYRNTEHTVIYAGASPGLHIPKLAEMFPLTRFTLIDPQPSAVKAVPGRIEIIEECMTNRLAAALWTRSSHILLISDVRIGASTIRETNRDQQIRIQRDMDAQMVWHEILNPVASMFKFRLPWDLDTHTKYLEGRIHLPVFGKRLTHESRLIVERGAKLIPYDNRRYERQMAHFNRMVRPAMHAGGRCYDCTAYRHILANYLGETDDDLQVEFMCAEIQADLEAKAREWSLQKRSTDSQPPRKKPMYTKPKIGPLYGL
jgi:hypothetical protein